MMGPCGYDFIDDSDRCNSCGKYYECHDKDYGVSYLGSSGVDSKMSNNPEQKQTMKMNNLITESEILDFKIELETGEFYKEIFNDN